MYSMFHLCTGSSMNILPVNRLTLRSYGLTLLKADIVDQILLAVIEENPTYDPDACLKLFNEKLLQSLETPQSRTHDDDTILKMIASSMDPKDINEIGNSLLHKCLI